MLNETAITQTLLNGTTVSSIVVPVASIVMTGITAIFTGIITFSVAYMSMKYNAKSVFIQANKDKVNEQVIKLADAARRNKIKEINSIMDSGDNFYIPEHLKKKIKREIKKELNPNSFEKLYRKKDELFFRYLKKEEFPCLYDRILSIINKYISP
jgi:hypothetical protein